MKSYRASAAALIATTKRQAEVDSRIVAAAQVILGGAYPELFWGFGFDDFVSRFKVQLAAQIGDPYKMPPASTGKAPLTGDVLTVRETLTALDGSPTAASLITEIQVQETLARSRVVGLSGPIGSGKDTLADALVSAHGFQKVAFGSALRAAASLLYAIPMHYFLDRELKETPLEALDGRSPRRILQLLGTEVGRAIHTDLWTRRLALSITALAEPMGRPCFVVSDVRMQNEVDLIRSIPDGTQGNIRRPDQDAVAHAKGNGHASESGFTYCAADISFVNEGSEEEYVRCSLGKLGVPSLRLRNRGC